MISGIVTLAAFGSFIGIAVWAWSRRNRARFEAASRLPLEDEAQAPSTQAGDRKAGGPR